MQFDFRQPNLDDRVTDHMRLDQAMLRMGQTAGEAIEWLRRHPPGGRIIYFYVVEDDGVLRGVVPTRQLVLSMPETPLADIMVRQVAALPARATVLDACEFFILHRLLAFPVVDDAGKLVGVVDLELYTQELTRLDDAQQREDLFQVVGVPLAGAQQTNPWLAFTYRFPWLGCNIAAGVLAAFLTGPFADDLNRVVALAFFIPVALNPAESVSSQSVVLALQLMHGRRPTWTGMGKQLRVELGTGLLLGLASGGVVGFVSLAWLHQVSVALCMLGGIAGGVTVAALGLILPFLLRLLRLDPRVAAGPVALAGADVVTILLYLNLARYILS